MSTRYKDIGASRSSYEQRYGINTIEYGKVTEVFSNTGNLLREGTIRVSSTLSKVSSLVYPINFGIQQLPALGEVVPIYYNNTLEKYYYGPAINIHNFPTHNSTDPVVQETPDYIEPTTINPYTIFAGDTILQGRFGQSIRLSQPIPEKTPWGGVQGASSIILSSGQVGSEDGSSLLLEDVNEDASSMYLLEEGSVVLFDSSKRDSYEETPQSANEFQGNQIVLASNRLYFNAREESILLSAQNASIGLSANTVNIDGVSSIRLDAPSYNLQADTFTSANQTRSIDSETATYNLNQFDLTGTNINVNYSRIGLGEAAAEPLLQSTEFLADLATLNANLAQLGTALTGVVALLAALPGGQAPATALQTAAASVTSQATSIQTKVGSGAYLSTTVFTK